jgi:uncharacterized PurR-regulated membrane protein YhhQ (DUF165 family)
MQSNDFKTKLLPENKLVKYVLLLKIAFTITGIVSYLFFPKDLIVSMGIAPIDSIRFIRSLGLAYAGLLFVYSSGYFQIIKKNVYPVNVVLFGIVMNGGAVILSTIYMLIDLFNDVDFSKNIIRYVTLLLFFFIALMLILSIIKNYKKYKNDIIWNVLFESLV